jgi:AcrR family transcriptional regulator
MQGVADAAGVSKALVLYHFESKAALLTAIVADLAARSAERLLEASRRRDVGAAWRALGAAACVTRELALLAALTLEPDVPAAHVRAVQEDRDAAATRLAERLLASYGLRLRVPSAFAGRLLLRELDALVIARARETPDAATTDEATIDEATTGEATIDAEQDAMLLALLALGR